MKKRKFKDDKTAKFGKAGEGEEEMGSRTSKRGSKKSRRGNHNSNNRNSDVYSSSKNSNMDSRKGANDVTWYTRTPEQVVNAANISFMNALGQDVQVFDNMMSHVNVQTSAPGVMRIGFIPTFGNPQVPSDAMNTAARKVYQFIRNYNSGSTNYEAPDLMKYFMLMDCAYAYAGFLIRTYGLVNSYSAANRFWPETFFVASGVDFNSVKNNIATFRTAILNYIAKVNSMVVPGTLPIFQRHFWMASNVYKDSDSFWSQTYIYVPEVYGVYDKDTADVQFLTINKPAQTIDEVNYLGVEDLMIIADNIIDSIALNEDFNTMAGDVLKAYQGNVFRIEGFTADFVLYPVYDAGVLNQMMNSRALGYLTKYGGSHNAALDRGDHVYSLHEDVDSHAIQLVQNGDPLEFIIPCLGDMTDYINVLNNRQYMINLTVESPTPTHVIESTRLTATSHYETGVNICRNILDGCGADVLTTFTIFFFNIEPNGKMNLRFAQPFCSEYIDVNPDTYPYYSQTILTNLINLASFDWHPIINFIVPYINDVLEYDGPLTLPPFVDLYRTAVTDAKVINNIHDVANLSLFNVTLTNPIQG